MQPVAPARWSPAPPTLPRRTLPAHRLGAGSRPGPFRGAADGIPSRCRDLDGVGPGGLTRRPDEGATHVRPIHDPACPERLLALLDRLGAVLADRGDAVALLGLGSVGRDLHRLDEHSDADFFVVVDDPAARQRYLSDLDWLEAARPVLWSSRTVPSGGRRCSRAACSPSMPSSR